MEFKGRTYSVLEWNGEQLGTLLALDTETTIAPFTQTPDMVLGVAYDGGSTVYLLHPKSMERFLKQHTDSTFIFLNAPFDIDVINKVVKQNLLIPKYNRNQIMDIGVLYRLLGLAKDGFVPKKYNLALLSKELLEIELDKDEERLTFGQYLGMPIKSISEAHLQYAAKDAVATLECYLALRNAVTRYDKGEALLSHDIQVKGDYALNQIYKTGIGFDVKRRDRWLKAALKRQDAIKNRLATWGWVRGVKGVNERFEGIITMLGIEKFLPRTEDGKISSAEDDLKPFTHLQFIKDFLDYTSLEKQMSFVLEQEEERVHPRYELLVNTGRTSCIAEGSLIQCLGESKPIEEVKIGDYVYSYSNTGKLELKRVTNTLKQGVKNTIKIKWKALGSMKEGYLICTPDHNIKVRPSSNPFFKVSSKEDGWYRADSLVKGDRIYHCTINYHQGRRRVFSVDVDGKQEQLLIKEQIFNEYDHKNKHIHHIDHNKSNNSLDNLEIIDAKEHNSLHSIGNIPWNTGKELVRKATWEELYNQYREWYLRKGSTKEYYSILNRAKRAKIPLKNISRHFKNGKEITYEMLVDTLSMKAREAEKYTGLDFRTWKKALKFHGMCTNHIVTEVVPHEEMMTYDLTVEDNHNFIASELCVHNCGKPNIQQLPRDGVIRSFYQAKEGHALVITDYSAIELSTLAQVAVSKYGKSIMADRINAGNDLHKYYATVLYGITEDLVTKEQRQSSKAANFGFPGGLGTETFLEFAKGYGLNITKKDALAMKNAWFEAFPEMRRYLADTKEGSVTTLTGRVRANAFYCAAANTPFQGLAADGAKLALFNLISCGIKVVAFIHDEIVCEVKENEAEVKQELIKKIMISSMRKVVPDVKVGVESIISKRYKK